MTLKKASTFQQVKKTIHKFMEIYILKMRSIIAILFPVAEKDLCPEYREQLEKVWSLKISIARDLLSKYWHL